MRGRSRQRSSRVPGSGTPEKYFANARPNRESCGASCANSVRQAWNLRPAVAPKISNADFPSIASTRSIHCLRHGPGTGYCQQACASSLNAKPKRIVQGCRPGEAAWVQRGGDQALSCRRTGRHAGPGQQRQNMLITIGRRMNGGLIFLKRIKRIKRILGLAKPTRYESGLLSPFLHDA